MSDRYEKNPFKKDIIISTKSKPIKLSRLNPNKIDKKFGSHITDFNIVNDQTFDEMLINYLSKTFELKSAGKKSLKVLIWVCRENNNTDKINLDNAQLENFIQKNPNDEISKATLDRGLRELEKGKIIAKTTKKGFYFINPNFNFTGSRMAFTTIIEK